MYIIDTDILASELLYKYQLDDSVKKTVAFYRKIPLMKRIIPDFVVNEFELFMTNVIPNRFLLHSGEKKQLSDIVVAYLRQISTNCTLIYPNRQIMKNAFLLYQQYKNDIASNHISFTDSLLLATAIQMQYTILTLDQTVKGYASELRIPYFELKID